MTMQALAFLTVLLFRWPLWDSLCGGLKWSFPLFSMAKVEEVSKAKSGGGEKVS